MKNNDTFMNNKILMDKNRPFMCRVSIMYFFVSLMMIMIYIINVTCLILRFFHIEITNF